MNFRIDFYRFFFFIFQFIPLDEQVLRIHRWSPQDLHQQFQGHLHLFRAHSLHGFTPEMVVSPRVTRPVSRQIDVRPLRHVYGRKTRRLLPPFGQGQSYPRNLGHVGSPESRRDGIRNQEYRSGVALGGTRGVRSCDQDRGSIYGVYRPVPPIETRSERLPRMVRDSRRQAAVHRRLLRERRYTSRPRQHQEKPRHEISGQAVSQ